MNLSTQTMKEYFQLEWLDGAICGADEDIPLEDFARWDVCKSEPAARSKARKLIDGGKTSGGVTVRHIKEDDSGDTTTLKEFTVD